MPNQKQTEFLATESSGKVSAIVQRPRGARWLYVLAHGAGAGMDHPFMQTVADRLYDAKVATFRFNFPYVEAGKKRPDPPAVIEKTIRSAVDAAAKAARGLPMIAGGKSMGGRLTSVAQAKDPLPGVVGLAFLGFPLHAPNKPSDTRAAHLKDVKIPMLFLQGTRDSLANLDLLAPICKSLRKRATLHIIEGGDHSFKVPKRSGRTEDEVMDELIIAFITWAESMS